MSTTEAASIPRVRNDEKLNYLLRPAKNIERKMLCEALTKLSILANIADYQYVGFGSSYFADFSLFFKTLGMKQMISIEGDLEMEARVRLNCPYSCIDIRPGKSTEVLPGIGWHGHKTILWLDYTESLVGYMFDDMATFFNNALSGSIFILSINVDLKDEALPKKVSEKIKRKIESDANVKKRVKNELLNAKDLKKEDYYIITRNIIHEEIQRLLKTRNHGETNPFIYKQLFNFIYKDGVAMQTIGGILYSNSDADRIRQMEFEKLEFVREGNNNFNIHVPNLTNREIQLLNKFLPRLNNEEDVKDAIKKEFRGGISEETVKKYAKIYRYYPVYAEVNI